LVVGGQSFDAGAEAALDVILQAGTRMGAREVHAATRNQEAFVNEMQNAASQAGGKERAEIERAVFFDAAGEIDAREFLAGGEFDVRVRFVVPQHDVELRLVALDEAVFEGQGFAGIVDDDSVEIGDFARQRAGLGIDPARFEEVAARAAAQRGSFADIDDLTAGVFEDVDAGGIGEEGGFFAWFHGVWRCGATKVAALPSY
jgi:hypothetical protein